MRVRLHFFWFRAISFQVPAIVVVVGTALVRRMESIGTTISTGFAAGFAEWLAHTSGYDVRLARQGEALQAGVAYVAPDGQQMAISGDGTIVLQHGAPDNGMCPSVSFLFRSVAAVSGAHAIGILLTGMGCDGALELKQMRQAGALTIAQNQESSTVFGMPGEAVNIGAATYVLAPEEIAAALVDIVKPLER